MQGCSINMGEPPTPCCVGRRLLYLLIALGWPGGLIVLRFKQGLVRFQTENITRLRLLLSPFLPSFCSILYPRKTL